MVKEDLEMRGYDVVWLRSGDQAEQELGGCDLSILDIMLPGLDGFTIGQRLKKAYPQKPLLMLSARTAVEDKLLGLQFADDYVTKPFHAAELAARIAVLLRRFGAAEPAGIVTLGHIQVHLATNSVMDMRSGSEIKLTGKQFQILMYFLRHPNQILMKEQIYEAVWGTEYWEGDKTLAVHIRYLREKLEADPSNPVIIETIRGLGYRVRQ